MRGTKASRFLLMGLLGVATALGAASSARADDRHYHGSGHNSGHGRYSQGYHSYGHHGGYRAYGGYRCARPYYGGYGYARPYGYGYGGYGYGYGYAPAYGYAYAPPPAYVPYRPYCGPRVGFGLSLGFHF